MMASLPGKLLICRSRAHRGLTKLWVVERFVRRVLGNIEVGWPTDIGTTPCNEPYCNLEPFCLYVALLVSSFVC